MDGSSLNNRGLLNTDAETLK